MRLLFRFGVLVGGLFLASGGFLWAQNTIQQQIDDANKQWTEDVEAKTSENLQKNIDAYSDRMRDESAKKKACSSCSDSVWSSMKSCLGPYGDGKAIQNSPYKYGSNNGDYCMRLDKELPSGEKLQMACDYIGTADPTATGFNPEEKDFCCGVKLNTKVPFVGRCIATDGAQSGTQPDSVGAFARLMRALANIAMTLIMVGSLVMLVVSGVLWASNNPSDGKKLMRKVILSLVLLGASGIILRLINPVFFQ